MITALRAGAVALTLSLPLSAAAIEYRSVASTAILYDAPSSEGRKVFIIARGTPVEVLVEQGDWIRVREPGGAITWVERGALRQQRTLMVTSDSAVVRQAPDPGAAVVFEAARDVVLELASPPSGGWAEVRHQDGKRGFVRITEVWGH